MVGLYSRGASDGRIPGIARILRRPYSRCMLPVLDALRGCARRGRGAVACGTAVLLLAGGCGTMKASPPPPIRPGEGHLPGNPAHPVFLADQAVGDFADARLEIGGGTIDVRFQGHPGASREQVLQWIGRAGEAVTHYYGRF